MDQDMLSQAIALRDQAYQTFKAFDDAVVSLGGKSRQARTHIVTSNASTGRGIGAAVAEGVRRRTQSGAAELILRERGAPLTIHNLMAELPNKGVILGGADPQINFTSSLSKSGKFVSIRRGGNYYWWFKNEPLPSDWQEAPDLPLRVGSDASAVGTNEEGGDVNAATTPS